MVLNDEHVSERVAAALQRYKEEGLGELSDAVLEKQGQREPFKWFSKARRAHSTWHGVHAS